MEGQQEPQTQSPKKSFSWKAFLWDKKWLLLLLLPLIVTVMVRLEPMKLVPLENSVAGNVYNFYKAQIRNEIEKQYPNLPDAEQDRLAETRLNEVVKQNKDQIEAQVKQSTEQLKTRVQYESGSHTYVYLGDIDSYYWLRMARNIVEKGTQCDKYTFECVDTYTMAPIDAGKEIDYYPIVIVINYKILKIFNPDMSLMQASFLTPLILSLLLTIPLFLLLRKIGGNILAVVGSVLVNVNPMVLSRSLGSDSDIVNVFFQAVFLWLAVECFYAKSPKAKYIWAGVIGLLLAVYSKFWTGWWYLGDLFLAALAFGAVFIVVHHYYETKKWGIKELKKPLTEIGLVALCFIGVIFVFYGLIFASLGDLMYMVQGQFGVLKFKVAANPDLWPNVLTTVAEFNKVNFSQIIDSFGSSLGIPLMLMALLGIVFLVFPNTKFIKKNFLLFIALLLVNFFVFSYLRKNPDNRLAIFLILVPLIVGLYAHLKIREENFHSDAVFLLIVLICLVTSFSMIGVRFLFLMAIPVSIFAAIFFIRITHLLLTFIKSTFKIPKVTVLIGMLILSYFFLVAPVSAGISTARNYLPNVSDEWVATLEKIRTESMPNAIINSWWDFGHWFKFFADRRVTLDGSSQNNPQLHWLGKLLLTNDETTSVGILRMLDCGANTAFDVVNKKMNDTPHAMDVLNQIIVLKKEEARKVLKNHSFSDQETEEVLKYTHCDAPENFLITSEDMIGKSGVWAHFGSWNFKKAYLSSAVSQMPDTEIIKKFEEDYNIPEETTKSWMNSIRSFTGQDQVNSWIAPWPNYFSGLNSCEKEENGTTAMCQFQQENGPLPVVVNFDTKEAYLLDNEQEKKFPEQVAFIENDGFDLVFNDNNTIGFGMAIYRSGGDISAVTMAPALTGSMFTRLFFFDGAGLKNFEKFYDTTSVYGDRIITWKVKWPEEKNTSRK